MSVCISFQESFCTTTTVSVSLEEVSESDEVYLTANPGFTLSVELPVSFKLEAFLDTDSPLTLEIFMESHANTPGIGQRIPESQSGG